MSGMVTACRTETFQNLQLNAGIILKNFDIETPTDATALKTAITTAVAGDEGVLGATRGGGTFTVTREIREPEVDGRRYSFRGGRFVDRADANLSATLIETTPENIALLLGTGGATTSGKKTTIEMHTAIEDTDYLDNIVWVGDLSDGRLVAIVLYNALNTADFSLTFTDKGEGTLAAEFHAHQENVEDYDTAPFKVVFFDTDGTAGELTFTSTASAATVGNTVIATSNTLGAGEHYVYKTGNTAPSIGYHEQADYTWTEWDGTSEITVGASMNGKKITIAVVDSRNRAIKTGNATLAVKTA